MTSIWILVIATGCTGWGCGSRHSMEFPSEAACYRSLEKVQLLNAAKQVGGDSQNQAAAYCYPKPEEKK